MPQVAALTSDTALGNYVPTPSSPATGFDKTDEASPDDSDYISSTLAPSSEVYVGKFASLTDPLSSVNHDFDYRYRKNQAGGAQIDLTVELRQGYVSEGSPGTLIATYSHTDISNTWTTANQTLTTGEADTITDYTDLYLRLVFTQV